MLNKLLAATAIAAMAYAFVPAHAARVAIGCSGADQAKAEGTVDGMADGPPKFMAQGEMARAQEAMLKGDLRTCALHLSQAMHAGSVAQAPYPGTMAQAPYPGPRRNSGPAPRGY